MNISEAAAQLERAVRAYGVLNPDGSRRVPLAAQRPVYLIGPPGVGKTEIVAQTARTMELGYAAYTMTHHTRQSALGLPSIVRRTMNGRETAVTEYTMSEILAGVWEKAEAGAERGILFLDEINCVSESLMPAMLQLLQYKTFGVHALPEGWMIVCAGNPPRYNRYAHTFDGVLMDRLRVIEVEPDLDAWRAYAAQRGVHPAILSYLALKPEDFYLSDGDRVVTARSWTDLSLVMRAMEAAGDVPDGGLLPQYLQIPEVSERFGLYLRLCAQTGARLDEALAGNASPSLADLPFDEAVFAMLLLADRLTARAADCAAVRREADRLGYFADGAAREAAQTGQGAQAACAAQLDRLAAALAARQAAGSLSGDEAAAERLHISRLREVTGELRGLDSAAALDTLQDRARQAAADASERERSLEVALAHAFDFLDASVPDPNARLVFLNALRISAPTQRILRPRLAPRFDRLWKGCVPED